MRTASAAALARKKAGIVLDTGLDL